jgi:hypothetical protein
LYDADESVVIDDGRLLREVLKLSVEGENGDKIAL